MENVANEIKPFDFEGQELKTIMIDSVAWFAAYDVARILGYKKPNNAVKRHVDEEDKNTALFRGSIGNPNKTVINESGLYSLILSSKLENAKKFKRWVTSVVLPEIRKTGSFNSITNKQDSFTIDDPIARAKRWIEEKQQMLALEANNKEMKPKAEYADAIISSDDVISVNQLAKLLSNKVTMIGQNKLFAWLRDNNYLNKRKGVDWNTPTQRSMTLGLMKVKQSYGQDHEGNTRINKTPRITGKGQQYFVNQFIKKNNLLITGGSNEVSTN